MKKVKARSKSPLVISRNRSFRAPGDPGEKSEKVKARSKSPLVISRNRSFRTPGDPGEKSEKSEGSF
jgi:hypothetical protein